MSSPLPPLRVCIMAGGKGERFWPASRAARPKQLLPIASQHSLIAETVQRNLHLVPGEHIYVVTTQDQAPDIQRELPVLPPANIIAEPFGKNTTPCIALITALVAAHSPDIVLAVVPADHVIPDAARYAQTLRDAATVAAHERAILTIGIAPRSPETGYGYILASDGLPTHTATAFSRVEQFIEKPPLPRAEELIATGRAFWNAGMFVFRVADMLAAFQQFLPETHSAVQHLIRSVGTPDEHTAVTALYATAPAISIDYAVMEKARNVIVAHGLFAWDDVGSWAAVADHWPHDAAGNAVRGEVLLIDSTGCVVQNDGPGITAVLGLHDLVVVRTSDAVLVCPKTRAQDVKQIVQRLLQNPAWRPFT
ncbi:MAG: sugar phosphate nucleotidyltransferase [bacterium]|nr:sugar phosphate nucleotidyltransferase [bacterium]